MLPLRRLVALASCMALAGCGAPVATPTPVPPVVPVTPTASSSPAAPLWAVDQFTNDDPRLPVHGQWPVVPGAPGLTRALGAEVRERADRFLADSTPMAFASPELQSTWEVLLETPSWVGVRLSFYEFSGASGYQSSSVRFGERTGGRTIAARELIAPAARQRAADLVVAAIEDAGYTVLDDLVSDSSARDSLLEDLHFTPHGELVVRVGEGVILASSDGVVDVTLKAADVAGLLSEVGFLVRDASTSVVPSPTPSASASAAPVPVPARAAVDCVRVACVALTFDDGPGADTGRLLDLLAERQVPATFFLLGTSVRVHPDLVVRMASEGHEVGNHTWSHKQLTKLSEAQQREEIARDQAAIGALGVRATVFRPPYGSQDAVTRKVAGLPVILWDVDTLDWKTRDAAATVAAVQKDARAGSIILMHDIHASSVDAVPGVIDALRAKGLTPVTVSQLIGDPQAGRAYSRRP